MAVHTTDCKHCPNYIDERIDDSIRRALIQFINLLVEEFKYVPWEGVHHLARFHNVVKAFFSAALIKNWVYKGILPSISYRNLNKPFWSNLWPRWSNKAGPRVWRTLFYRLFSYDSRQWMEATHALTKLAESFKSNMKTFIFTDPVSMSNISAPKLHQSTDLSWPWRRRTLK